MSKPKKQKHLPAPLPKLPANLSRENLESQLREGNLTVDQAGEFLSLTKEQIEFAKRYLQDYSGDGVECAGAVYNLNLQNRQQLIRATTIAKRLLGNADVITLITLQLNSRGLNDTSVDKVLHSLVLQSADKKVQLQAVKLYNEQTNRIKRQEEELNKQAFDYSKLTDEQLRTLVEFLEVARVGGTESLIKTTEITTNEVNQSEVAEAEIIN